VGGRRQGRERGRASAPSPDDDNVTISLDEPALTDDRAAEYRDWADRLHDKRETNRRRIRGDADEPAANYWTADNVYRESRRLVDEEAPRRSDPVVVRDLLAVFGIVGEPRPRQVELEFRRLAKVHHPDRHVDADADTREYHLDQMRRINEAYARLRQLELA
jgi:hypothetical protein